MTIKSVNSQFDMEDEKNKKQYKFPQKKGNNPLSEKDELENFHGFNDLNEDTMSVDVKIAAKVDEIGHKVNDIDNLKSSKLILRISLLKLSLKNDTGECPLGCVDKTISKSSWLSSEIEIISGVCEDTVEGLHVSYGRESKYQGSSQSIIKSTLSSLPTSLGEYCKFILCMPHSVPTNIVDEG
uniref:Uncharacterized protein n=1 Tax=Glossina palpalis gambiensis TaxID=67801 RepID=A0A1B0BTS2_9MUSC